MCFHSSFLRTHIKVKPPFTDDRKADKVFVTQIISVTLKAGDPSSSEQDQTEETKL